MDCERCRISISARLDGEAEAAPAADVDAHLDQCARCRAYQADAGLLTRNLRVRLVTDTPDLVGPVLARAERPDRRRTALRSALALVAVAQILLGTFQLLGLSGAHGHAHGGMAAHLFNESAAWNLAIGVGMLWAAWRDRTAGGVLPVLGAFVAVLAGFSVHDLIAGTATLARVGSHALLLAGLGLLVAVHRRHRGDGDPAPAQTGGDGWSRIGPGEPPEVAEDGPHLRPTAHHRAA